jgi:hypothetical protein
MSIFASPNELAAHLSSQGVQCEILDDGFVALPDPDSELTATLELTGGWLVFKAFIADWQPANELAACLTLLRLHDRLSGFRFSVTEGEMWVLQDFPVEVLSEHIRGYFEHAFFVLGTILPTLLEHLRDDRAMSEDEIDAMFQRLDAHRIH